MGQGTQCRAGSDPLELHLRACTAEDGACVPRHSCRSCCSSGLNLSKSLCRGTSVAGGIRKANDSNAAEAEIPAKIIQAATEVASARRRGELAWRFIVMSNCRDQ